MNRAFLSLLFILLPMSAFGEQHWQGSALIRGQWRFLEAVFPDDPQSDGKVDFPQQRHELKSLRIQNDLIQFTLQRGAVELRFNGRKRGTTIQGTIDSDGSRGAFQLTRVGEVQFGGLSQLIGTYRAENGQVISVAKFSFGDGVERLALMDSHTGLWGILLHRSESRFTFMPARYAPFPATFEVDFGLSGSLAATTVQIKDGGRILSSARRVNVHREEEVSFRNGDVSLSGTLIRPLSASPHPVVVMLHSSGHQSRNGPAAYFRLLANYFAAEGIASLIYDKRGVDQSTGSWDTASFDDLAGDGARAVEFLKEREGIDGKRISVWGISQGGWLAPLVASRLNDVSFFITVSGAAVGTADQETYRVLHAMMKEGFSTEDVSAAEAYMKLYFAVVNDAEPWDKLQTAIRPIRNTRWARFVALPAGSGELSWWKRVRDFNPRALLSQLTVPSLHIFGEWDDDVSTDESVRVLATLPGTHRHVTVIPTADHYMINTPKDLETVMPTLSTEYLRGMVTWIQQRRPGQ